MPSTLSAGISDTVPTLDVPPSMATISSGASSVDSVAVNVSGEYLVYWSVRFSIVAPTPSRWRASRRSRSRPPPRLS